MALVSMNALALAIGLGGDRVAEVKARAGQAAVVNLPLLFASSMRRNIWATLMRKSPRDVSFVHQCLGFIIVVEILLHVSLRSNILKEPWFIYLGFLGLIFIVILTPTVFDLLRKCGRFVVRPFLGSAVVGSAARPRFVSHILGCWNEVHIALTILALGAIGMHIPSSLLPYLLAGGGLAVLDLGLTSLQILRTRPREHACLELLPNDSNHIQYSLVSLHTGPLEVKAGSFVYVTAGPRRPSRPVHILWYTECCGTTAVRQNSFDVESKRIVLTQPEGSRRRRDHGTPGNRLWFLIRSKGRDTVKRDWDNRPVWVEGPYSRPILYQNAPSSLMQEGGIHIFAADEGIIPVLSHVKGLCACEVDIKIRWYTKRAALLFLIRRFFEEEVCQYLLESQFVWVLVGTDHPDLMKHYSDQETIYYEIRKNYCVEQDVTDTMMDHKRVCIAAAGDEKFRNSIRIHCRNGDKGSSVEFIEL